MTVRGEPIRLGFVCVQNAGRSQMATAFAERERAERGLEEEVEIVTGGTHPADAVQDVVVRVMGEAGDPPRRSHPAGGLGRRAGGGAVAR